MLYKKQLILVGLFAMLFCCACTKVDISETVPTVSSTSTRTVSEASFPLESSSTPILDTKPEDSLVVKEAIHTTLSEQWEREFHNFRDDYRLSRVFSVTNGKEVSEFEWPDYKEFPELNPQNLELGSNYIVFPYQFRNFHVIMEYQRFTR